MILVKVLGKWEKRRKSIPANFFGLINGWKAAEKVGVRQAGAIIFRTQWSTRSSVTGHSGSIWGRFLISSSAFHSWAKRRNASNLDDAFPDHFHITVRSFGAIPPATTFKNNGHPISFSFFSPLCLFLFVCLFYFVSNSKDQFSWSSAVCVKAIIPCGM